MTGTEWKVGDKAMLWGDTPVALVEPATTGDIWFVRYDRNDRFGERATFAADVEELERPGSAEGQVPEGFCLNCGKSYDDPAGCE